MQLFLSTRNKKISFCYSSTSVLMSLVMMDSSKLFSTADPWQQKAAVTLPEWDRSPCLDWCCAAVMLSHLLASALFLVQVQLLKAWHSPCFVRTCSWYPLAGQHLPASSCRTLLGQNPEATPDPRVWLPHFSASQHSFDHINTCGGPRKNEWFMDFILIKILAFPLLNFGIAELVPLG